MNLYVKINLTGGGFFWNWIAKIQNDGHKFLVPLLKGDGNQYKITIGGMYEPPVWESSDD